MLRAEITIIIIIINIIIIMSRQVNIFAFLTFSLTKSQSHLLITHEKAYE